MSVLHRKKPLRDWLITADEGAKALHITKQGFKALVREGFIRSADRAGMYRLGSVIDGYAEAVRMGRLAPPHARSNGRASLFAELQSERPKCKTLKNAVVHGLTISGALLLDAENEGYRVEVGPEGVERLRHLCELDLKDRSTRPETAEPIQKS